MTFIFQGRKRVDLGSRVFIYDESRYLLTSLDLPVVTQVSKQVTNCLSLR